MNNANIQIDLLKYTFIKAKERMLEESEALQINLTKTFWKTIADKVEHGELLNIGVRGEVRTGKSTAIIKIAWEINKLISRRNECFC